MQQIISLQLVAVGAGVAWFTRQRTVKHSQNAKPNEADDGTNAATEADLERSATQWLARNGPAGLNSSLNSEPATVPPSSYADLELLSEGDLVYLRAEANILTALVPAARRLELQPLQLAKGKPEGVPTAPLESTSVWVVRRWKQHVAFELQGPHNRRHVLEADPSAPHGVALGGWNPGRRGRWLITPKGLVSTRWQEHVLPLQVVPVQLVDARAVTSVKTSLGKKLADLTARLEEETKQRSAAEAQRDQLDTELRATKEDAGTQAAELRSQIDAALRARHAAERDVSSLQAQKADESMRAKMAQSRASQLEHELQQSEATVRRQQQQIQGMLAGHAEELRTLQQELQIAREANEGLKRAMGEQVLSLQGALELRDARILELEEENDRMDTVLQVIQAQLGGACGSISLPDRSARRHTLGSQPGDPGAAAAGAAGAEGGSHSGEGEISLLEMVRQAPGSGGGEEPPLWRSLLDLTGDLSLTALKESLAISRRVTMDAPAQAETPKADPTFQPSPAAQSPLAPVSSYPVASMPGLPSDVPAQANAAANGAQAAAHPWALPGNPDGATSSVGSTGDVAASAASTAAAVAAAATGEWSSGGGESGSLLLGGEDGEFVSAAERMSGVLRSTGGGEAAAGSTGGGAAPHPPLQLQHAQQVSGAAGRGLGGDASAAEQVVGGGSVERPGGVSTGGFMGLAPIQTGPGIFGTVGGTPRSVGGAVSTPQTGTATAGGPTAAQLEYGLEATLTLDSLRRRMRQLDAEKERLELLRASLEESLPWRAPASGGGTSRFGPGCGPSAAGAGPGGLAEGEGEGRSDGAEAPADGDAAAGTICGAGMCTAAGQGGMVAVPAGLNQDSGAGGSGTKDRGVSEAEQGACRRDAGQVSAQHAAPQPASPSGRDTAMTTTDSGKGRDLGSAGKSIIAQAKAQEQPQQQQRTRPLTQSERRRLKRGMSSKQSPSSSVSMGASPGSPAAHQRPLSDAAVMASLEGSPHGSPSGRVRRIAQQFGGSGGGAVSGSASSSPAGTSRLRSSGGAPGTAAAAQQTDGVKAAAASGPTAAATADLASSPPDTARERRDDRTQTDDARATVNSGANTEPRPPVETSTAAGRGPGAQPGPSGPLRLPELKIDHGRGLAHADEEGYGVYDSIDAMCNLGSTRAMPSFRGVGALTARRGGHSRQLSASAVDAGPAPEAVAAARSSARPTGPSHAPSGGAAPGTPTAAATGTVVTTPKSVASTPGAGTDVGLDDDAAVHCDDQELSPPQGVMLLGSLEELRSAAASSLGAVGGGPAGVRLSAFHEEEEEDE